MEKCSKCGKRFESIKEFPKVRVLGITNFSRPDFVRVGDTNTYSYGFFRAANSGTLDESARRYAMRIGQLGKRFEYDGVIYAPLGKRKVYTASLDITREFNEVLNSKEVQEYLEQLRQLEKTQTPVPFRDLHFKHGSTRTMIRGHEFCIAPILFDGFLDGRRGAADFKMEIREFSGDFVQPDRIPLSRLELEGVVD